MPFIYLENTENSVLIQLEPGKPDRSAKYEEGVVDARPRVKQSAQKGGTCQYYALNFLRPRIGQHPDLSEHPLRKIEKTFSQYRKEMTKASDALVANKALLEFVINSDLKPFELWIPANARRHAPSVKFKEARLGQQQSINSFGNFLELIGTCPHRDINLFLMAAYLQQVTFILVATLTQLGIDIEAMYETDIFVGRQHFKKSLDELSVQEKSSALFSMLNRQLTASYPQLETSDWTHKSGVDGLIEELKKFGPMLVNGYYGEQYYPADSLMLVEERAGVQLYGWRVENYKAAELAHSIVLVGAFSRGDEAQVVFVDPNDESDPLNPKSQKFYMISYEHFKNVIFSTGSRRKSSYHADDSEFQDEARFLVRLKK